MVAKTVFTVSKNCFVLAVDVAEKVVIFQKSKF